MHYNQKPRGEILLRTNEKRCCTDVRGGKTELQRKFKSESEGKITSEKTKKLVK